MYIYIVYLYAAVYVYQQYRMYLHVLLCTFIYTFCSILMTPLCDVDYCKGCHCASHRFKLTDILFPPYDVE